MKRFLSSVFLVFLSIFSSFAQDNFDKAMKAFKQKNYDLMKKLFEEDCYKNIGKSCWGLGVIYEEGYGVKKDYKKAAYYYEKACKLNYGSGCYNLGFLYHKGQGVEQDYKKAAYYWEKACKLNNGLGCNNLGVLYYEGQGVEQDYKKAVYYYEKACKLDYGLGCNNLGSLYYEGQGVKQDYKKAVYYYEKACKLNGGPGCYNLGLLYEKGAGVPTDYKKALSFYKKSCDLGYKAACDEYTKLKNINNIPKPFGLVVGITTQDEFLSIAKQKNWNIAKKGNRIIKDDISNPNVYGYFVDNINLNSLSTAKFWFYKGKLMSIEYVLYEDINKSTFKSYYDKLKAKYGAPVRYREPYLAQGLAEWDFGNVKIELSVPWVSRHTYLEYKDINLVKAADKDDEDYYESYIQKTSKDIEGL